VLAKPKPEMAATIDKAESAEGLSLRSRFQRFGNVGVLTLAPGDTVQAAVKRLMATGRYEFVEPDFIRKAVGVVPNDPQFVNQWGLSNTGTNAGGGGIAGADINAELAWTTRTSAQNIIVGMIDSGALLTHQDLVGNLWMNPHPNSTASFADGSGSSSETDSLNGLNAVAMSGAPADDVGHGTLTSGVVGAVGDNSLGVTGVAWQVQLMELKFIASSGEGSTADELPCIEYAISHGVSVINASYGSNGFSQAEMDAIAAAGNAGIIFVCAAGNSAENIDISPFLPADYPLDNIICVGATDNRDLPVYFSNYGSGSVEIFAPGENILSTSSSGNTAYGAASGTSLAAPFVTGAVALLRAQFPADTYRQTINRILNSVDAKPALAGKAQTGGRLDLANALAAAPNTTPNALFAHRTNLEGLDPYTRSNNVDTPLALEAGAPSLVSGAGHSQWWQWTAPENATVEIDTSGSDGGTYFTGGSTYPTALGVYTGSSLGSLVAVSTNSDFGTEPQIGGAQVPYSEVSFHTQAGVTYQVLVQGVGGTSGQTILAINTSPDNDSISSPKVLAGPSVSILGANINASLQSGEPKILGNAGGHSLWYSWTAPSTGTFQVSAYSYDFTPEVAAYTGTSFGALALVSSSAGSALAGTTTDISECLCTISATAGTSYLIKVDGATFDDIGEFTLTIDDSQWQTATGDSVTCSPSVGADGTVYVGSNDNSLYAYGPGGIVKWSHAGQGIFDTSAAAIGPDGTIYAGNYDGSVYAFNTDGSVRWTYAVPGAVGGGTTGNSVTSSPALASDGTVYVHSSDGNLYALSAAGSLKWSAAAPGQSYSSPTVAPDGTIYIGTDSGTFYAFSPAGTQKWAFTTPDTGPVYTAAAIDAAGNLYIGTLTGNFYSVNSSGTLRWTYAVGDGITSAPALANGAVYFGGYDANLYALSASSGALQWKFPLGAQVRASAPAVDANGTVYIGCYDHNVYAVSPAGTLVRTYAADDWIRSSPVISGTMMYFGSNDHKVYAFNIGAGPASSDWPMYQYSADRPGRAVTYPLLIDTQPASQTIMAGSSFTLSVVASGAGGLSYQWSLNGAAIAGAVDSSYTVASASSASSGSYTVTVTSGSSSVTSAAATITVSASAPPSSGRIVNLSARANVGTGGNILIAGFAIEGTGNKDVVLRGVGPTLGTAPYNVSGVLAAPQLTLVNSSGADLTTVTAWGGSAALASAFSSVGAFALPAGSKDSAVEETLPAGSFTSQVAGVGGATGVALAEIYDADLGASSSSLVNISARADVGTGGNILIAGFAIEGSQPVSLLLRGVGPTLGMVPYNVSGVLAQPEITLFNSAGASLQSNSGWANSAALSAAFAQAGAFALAPGSADAAMMVTLPAGSYTLQLSGVGGSTGVGLVEVYLLP
jgi:outer membrane protein assembly factor BamB/subtilisin family serine protease